MTASAAFANSGQSEQEAEQRSDSLSGDYESSGPRIPCIRNGKPSWRLTWERTVPNQKLSETTTNGPTSSIEEWPDGLAPILRGGKRVWIPIEQFRAIHAQRRWISPQPDEPSKLSTSPPRKARHSDGCGCDDCWNAGQRYADYLKNKALEEL